MQSEDYKNLKSNEIVYGQIIILNSLFSIHFHKKY